MHTLPRVNEITLYVDHALNFSCRPGAVIQKDCGLTTKFKQYRKSWCSRPIYFHLDADKVVPTAKV